MADLLGSILGSMQKPPSLDTEEKRKAKEQRELIEKQIQKDKKLKQVFQSKMEKEIHNFIQDAQKEKKQFQPMDKVYRAIIHEVAEAAGLTSFSFGLDEQERHVMIWKKEFAPSDEELLAYREGRQWDPVLAKLAADAAEANNSLSTSSINNVLPTHNYKDKYKHLIGEDSAKTAAKSTVTKRSYGFVSSENKRDQRTIEQVMADSKARKKLKTDGSEPHDDLLCITNDNESVINNTDFTVDNKLLPCNTTETNVDKSVINSKCY